MESCVSPGLLAKKIIIHFSLLMSLALGLGRGSEGGSSIEIHEGTFKERGRNSRLPAPPLPAKLPLAPAWRAPARWGSLALQRGARQLAGGANVALQRGARQLAGGA